MVRAGVRPRRRGVDPPFGRTLSAVTGSANDKGRAARLVAGLPAVALGQPVVIAGSGDSANDEGVLAAVNYPYLVARGGQSRANLAVPGFVRTPLPEPTGWIDAIHHLLATRWV